MTAEFAGLAYPHPLRRHQLEALEALAGARAQGRQRAWVVLPPGAGKVRRSGSPWLWGLPLVALVLAGVGPGPALAWLAGAIVAAGGAMVTSGRRTSAVLAELRDEPDALSWS